MLFDFEMVFYPLHVQIIAHKRYSKPLQLLRLVHLFLQWYAVTQLSAPQTSALVPHVVCCDTALRLVHLFLQ